MIRIGQISGLGRTAYWIEDELIPALVKASRILGRFPNLQGVSIWRMAISLAYILLNALSKIYSVADYHDYQWTSPLGYLWISYQPFMIKTPSTIWVVLSDSRGRRSLS